MKADYILKSSAVFDSIKESPFPGGIAIKGNKIAGVLPPSELAAVIGPETEVIDYGDKLILPGFIDSHLHAGAAMDYVDESYCADLSPAKSFEEMIDLLKAFAGDHPDNPFILGINFNFFNLDKYVRPTADVLDRFIPDRPVFINTWDCHTFFTNSRAIRMTGITKDTPDPEHAVSKDACGELTGEFNDTASFLVMKCIARSFDERKRSLKNFMEKLNACGITSIADMYPSGNHETYPLFKSMEPQLTTRIHFYPSLMDFTPEGVEAYKKEYHSPLLQFSGLKCLIDGVLTVHTAWMLAPYTNKPETCGAPAIAKEKVRAKILQACKMGINVRIHTIGDAAVRYILDVFEEAERKYGRPTRRHCMEHIEYINPADIPRFASLGVVADMHPRHLSFYIDDAIDYLGEEREKYTWVFRDILRTGATIGTGSDFSVVDFNPMLGIYTAITRARDDGYPQGGWHPEQKLTLPEILKIYTIGSACAINRDADLGTLEAGKLADITVLEQNLFELDAPEILKVKPILTMMDGKIVYKK